MEKKALVGVLIGALLIIGAIFVSATMPQREILEEDLVIEDSQQTCGPSTCGGQCGGTCGIISCSCGR